MVLLIRSCRRPCRLGLCKNLRNAECRANCRGHIVGQTLLSIWPSLPKREVHLSPLPNHPPRTCHARQARLGQRNFQSSFELQQLLPNYYGLLPSDLLNDTKEETIRQYYCWSNKFVRHIQLFWQLGIMSEVVKFLYAYQYHFNILTFRLTNNICRRNNSNKITNLLLRRKFFSLCSRVDVESAPSSHCARQPHDNQQDKSRFDFSPNRSLNLSRILGVDDRKCWI